MWLIEDRAIIFRRSVWLMAATFAVKVATKAIVVLKLRYDMINNGAILCQVINIRHEYHSIFFIMDTNQKWNGGSPNFIIMLIIRTRWVGSIISIVWVDLIKMENNINIDLMAWIRKYIIHPSDKGVFFVLNTRGINDIRLISNPIQILIQLFDLKTNSVLKITIEKNNNLFEYLKIKKKKISASMFRVWTWKLEFSLSFYKVLY